MKIRCICIDDKNRPSEIPVEKWVKENEIYHITWIYKQLNQPGVKGVELQEFDISMCTPYNSYRLSRFAIFLEELDKFIQMCKDTSKVDDIPIPSFIEELIENGDLILK